MYVNEWICLIFNQGIYVTRVSKGGPAEVAGLMVGDKIMQVRIQGICLRVLNLTKCQNDPVSLGIVLSTRRCSLALFLSHTVPVWLMWM